MSTILYALCAGVVTIIMAYNTNKKLKTIDFENTKTVPYQRNLMQCITFALIVLSVGTCGYFVSQYSIIANIEIGICLMGILAAAVIDIKTKTIPNYISIIILILRVLIFVYEFLFTDTAIEFMLSSVLGGLICLIILLIANKIPKGGIGAGDIKLLASVGFMCGIYVVISTLLMALFSCIIISLVLIALKKMSSKDHLPFAPFIFIGYVVMCLFTLY